MKKLAAIIAAVGLSLCSLTGCAQSGVKNSAQATAENPMILTLAHGLSETHTVHIAMTEFADKVKERTNGRIQIQIFPNGQLGSENENMEQLMAGVISMTKVSAPGLATYNESYHTFGLPYIFDSTEDFYHVMDSDQMHDFFLSSEDDGFVTLTYYTSGARSFYTKNKAIRKPEDLKGLKIRVQDMKSQTDMMKALGGIPVAMSYGDVYTSLQTGIIDGTENNQNHRLSRWFVPPYKGILPALESKDSSKRFTNCNIIYLRSSKELILPVLFYRLTRERVNILL